MAFASKRILVSGAGSGIGRAAARALAAQGAELILLGRREAPLRETLAGARLAQLDHADEAAVAAFAQECPPLDGLLLCAGELVTGSVGSTPAGGFDRMIASNLRGPWLLCHHLGPKLREGGAAVFIGSNIGLRAIPDSAAYSVSKAGLHMLAKVLALEWAPRRIRCNAIAPGPIHTAMVEARLAAREDPEADLAKLATVNPLRRLGRPEEVAALALHLLSEESAWTTGAIIPCDGGAEAVY
jgi:2-keto-3-deoxy-L-fuconate dehydrogenase